MDPLRGSSKLGRNLERNKLEQLKKYKLTH